MENKKAQGLSINTIILIILGVIVLVALIFGFTKGWDGLKEWIAPSNNVNKTVTECRAACTTGSSYDFCRVERVIKESGKPDVSGTCKFLAENRKEYGVEACSLECPNPAQ